MEQIDGSGDAYAYGNAYAHGDGDAYAGTGDGYARTGDGDGRGGAMPGHGGHFVMATHRWHSPAAMGSLPVAEAQHPQDEHT